MASPDKNRVSFIVPLEGGMVHFFERNLDNLLHPTFAPDLALPYARTLLWRGVYRSRIWAASFRSAQTAWGARPCTEYCVSSRLFISHVRQRLSHKKRSCRLWNLLKTTCSCYCHSYE